MLMSIMGFFSKCHPGTSLEHPGTPWDFSPHKHAQEMYEI
jgi:hypothetical protein